MAWLTGSLETLMGKLPTIKTGNSQTIHFPSRCCAACSNPLTNWTFHSRPFSRMNSDQFILEKAEALGETCDLPKIGACSTTSQKETDSSCNTTASKTTSIETERLERWLCSFQQEHSGVFISICTNYTVPHFFKLAFELNAKIQ